MYLMSIGENIHIFSYATHLWKILIFSPHSMKYIWYLPQISKYPLFKFLSTNTLENLCTRKVQSSRGGCSRQVHNIVYLAV